MKTNKMKIRKIFLTGTACAALFLTGCASVKTSSNGFDASRVDPFIKLNETTLADVRVLLGTPTMMGVTQDGGHTVVGYGLAGHNAWGGFGRAMGKNLLTMGLGAKSYEYTVKTVLFKFDADNKVIDYKKSGASYLTKRRLTFWNECERKLTQQEINSPVNYGVSEICKIYALEIAAKEGIKADDVDTGKEFEFCNIPCQTIRGAVEAFGELKSQSDLIERQDGDGSKSQLLFD